VTQQRNCYKDEGRPCNALCTAYNEEKLEGTHCIELAASWAKARGLASLSASINKINTTVTLLAQAVGR